MATYQLISSVIVGSGGASSIDFTSIAATYTDLVLKASLRGTTAATVVGSNIKLNSTTTGYSSRYIAGDGASASSGTITSNYLADINAANNTASTFTNIEIYIPNYASSNNKSLSVDSVQEQNGTTAYAEMWAILWSNSSAINSIGLIPASNNFAQYSTAYLYGIKNS